MYEDWFDLIFTHFWHIFYHINNVKQKWAIRDKPMGRILCAARENVTAEVSYKNRALLTNHEANMARFGLSSFLFAFL